MLRQCTIILVLGVLVLLVACLPDDADDPPSVLDINPQNDRQRQTAAFLSATPPSATPLPPTPAPPTNTPLPTVVPPTATPLVFRDGFSVQAVAFGAWQTAPFTTLDGETRRLEDFIGQVVVVQTTSADCITCQRQTEALREAVQELRGLDNTQNVVFIVLSIDPLDTLQTLADYQAAHGLGPDEDGITWLTGIASQTWQRDVRAAFGDYLLQSDSPGFFFMDESGFGHVSDRGLMRSSRLRDVILHFLGQNFLVTPEPTPEPTSANNEDT